TLSGRLARARKLLAERLARRGLAPASAVPGMALPAAAVTANVPLQLAASTIRAPILVSAGAVAWAASAAISAFVSALAHGGPLHTTNFKPFVAALALLLGVFGLYALTAPVPPASTPDKPSVPKRWVNKHTFKHKAAVGAVALDGNRVAVGDEAGCLRLWDFGAGEKHELLLESGKLKGIRKAQPISLVQFSSDGKAVYLTLNEGSIFQYSLDNGGNQDRVFPENVQFTARNAHSLSPDGKFWLESITEFDPIEHSELMLSPNLLSEQGKELVG